VYSYVAAWIPVGAREAAFALLMAGGMLIGHAWTFQLVEPRRWSAVGLGTKAWRRDFIGLGALLGAMAILVPCVLLLAVRWLRIVPSESGSSLGAALATLAVLVPASLWEELFVRGYAYSVVRERWGPLQAIGLTSLVFAVMHLLNDGVSARVFVIVVLAGLFLGCIREATRSLYAAWAAHLSWNAVLVSLLHAPVSGLVMAAPDYRVVDSGPDWATGGSWGPEGGVFAAAGLVVALWYVFRRESRGEPNA
jgi:membrane protease YdiL (CAAX protease family)